jgi:hypothetical protein
MSFIGLLDVRDGINIGDGLAISSGCWMSCPGGGADLSVPELEELALVAERHVSDHGVRR